MNETLSVRCFGRAEADDEELCLTLHQAGKLAFRPIRDFAEQREMILKFNGQTREVFVEDGVLLRGDDFLGGLFGNARRNTLQRDSNLLRPGIDHANTALNVLVKDVATELRVKKLCRQEREHNREQHRHQSNEEIRHDQAIAKAPKESGAPPADEANQEIARAEQSHILYKTKYGAGFSDREQQRTYGYHPRREQVGEREPAPKLFELVLKGHDERDRKNTLPEERTCDEWEVES